MPSGPTRKRRVRFLLAVFLFIIVAILYTRRAPQVDSYATLLKAPLSESNLRNDGQQNVAQKQYEPVGAGKVNEKEERIQPTTTAVVVTSSTTEVATQETLAVSREKQAPVQEKQAPVHGKQTAVQEKQTAVQEKQTAVQEKQAPVQQTQAVLPAQSVTEIQDAMVIPSYDDVAEDRYEEEFNWGRKEVEVPPDVATSAIVHWSSVKENFPITSTIQLPTASAKALPRIQYTDLDSGKIDAEKLAAVKAAAKHAWGGYRELAMGADEVKPVSGNFSNPFNGWGATLVDSLDTLWIMNMTEAFEEAVEAVKAIDFTFSARSDIPLFETTIRYLGGLVAAYDVSGQRYRVLLDKAVELADILYGAFDTPNRMPQTYYQWRPAFASQPHRASNRIVLAELGTLSLEFTRLAQLTHEPKFYDAIARITDALEAWQNNTRVPGMWPIKLDGSGCRKPMQEDTIEHSVHALVPGGDGEEMVASFPVQAQAPHRSAQQELREDVLMQKPGTGKILGFGNPIPEGSLDSQEARKALLDLGNRPQEPVRQPLSGGKIIAFGNPIEEGGLDGKTREEIENMHSPLSKRAQSDELLGKPVCSPQGLASSFHRGTETFTLGGMSDSTYEYLPKQYMLLGGAVEQYRSMYLASAEAEIEKLLFRPMTPDDRDILISGVLVTDIKAANESMTEQLLPSGEHLTCFAGGMFAMGGKLFNRPQDVEIGRKLTEGCIWAYNSTTTGIMPEQFTVIKCEDRHHCTWNETKYWALLDPDAERRSARIPTRTIPEAESAVEDSGHEKRQLDHTAYSASGDTLPDHSDQVGTASKPSDKPQHPSQPPKQFSPLTTKEFARNKIRRERLPPGVVSIESAKYVLRPEAIESVFYMYRITGEQHWRDMGWQMFQAIEKYTRAAYGHSAIDNVTQRAPVQVDTMESFWLAETLKYFYLLFDDKDNWSLDDWVLNTEAHFFRRPYPESSERV
nr:putative endoplasmic reticulum mannosidase mnl2 [Quercus suber]